MKLAAFALTLIPGIAIASSWTSPGFPTFSTQETGRFTSHAALTKGTRALTLHIDQQCWQPSGAIKLNQMLSLKPCEGAPPQWRLFKDGDYTITVDTRSGTPTLLLSIKTEPERTAQLAYQCPVWDGSPLTLDVRQTFPEGTVVRDYYSGQTDTVQNGKSRCNLPTATGFYCWNARKPMRRRLLTGATPPFILCLRIAFAMAIQPTTTAIVAIRMVCKRLALSTAAICAG